MASRVVLGLALCAASAAAFQISPSALSPSAFCGAAISRKADSLVAAPRSRHCGPVMGANIRELRDRVTSVKNTRKITSAMRLVAAAKVRRAQDAVLKTRPFSETLQKVLGGLIVRLKRDNFESPLFAERAVTKVLLVVMTGDRGLCGGYISIFSFNSGSIFSVNGLRIQHYHPVNIFISHAILSLCCWSVDTVTVSTRMACFTSN